MKTVADVARLFDMDRDVVKKWCYDFADYLNPKANPPKGRVRRFTEADLRVLAVVFYYWEENPDYENIRACLDSRDHEDEHFVEFSRLHTSIFREPCDGLTEDSYGREKVTVTKSGDDGGFGEESRRHQRLRYLGARRISGREKVTVTKSGDDGGFGEESRRHQRRRHLGARRISHQGHVLGR